MRSTATRSSRGNCSRISACSVLRQVFENVGGIVGIEVADAVGDGLRRQLLEDFLAHRILDFGERGEVELHAEQLDEARTQLGVERVDQVAGVGFVEVAGERAQRRRVVALDGFADLLDKVGAQRALVVAQRRLDAAGCAVMSFWSSMPFPPPGESFRLVRPRGGRGNCKGALTRRG